MNLWCLHGNLQGSSVWDRVEEAFLHKQRIDKKAIRFYKPEVWSYPLVSMQDWVSCFLEKLPRPVFNEEPNVLMGYSMGGRLALNALVQKPDLWEGIILIAAHPGLPSVEERSAQCQFDDKWAEKFLKEPWLELMTEWNRLPVFGGRPNLIQLKEGTIPRKVLSTAFTVFSKGRQRYLTPELARIEQVPLLYIAGNEDAKYTQIGLELEEQCPSVSFQDVNEACHRVPWENTAQFVEVVQQFIARIG